MNLENYAQTHTYNTLLQCLFSFPFYSPLSIYAYIMLMFSPYAKVTITYMSFDGVGMQLKRVIVLESIREGKSDMMPVVRWGFHY